MTSVAGCCDIPFLITGDKTSCERYHHYTEKKEILITRWGGGREKCVIRTFNLPPHCIVGCLLYSYVSSHINISNWLHRIFDCSLSHGVGRHRWLGGDHSLLNVWQFISIRSETWNSLFPAKLSALYLALSGECP